MEREGRNTKCLSQIINGTEENNIEIRKSVSDSKLFNGDANTKSKNPVEALTEIFLENNINSSQDREVFLQEQSKRERTTEQQSDLDSVEIRPHSSSRPRSGKTPTVLVSEAFNFLKNNLISTVLEDDVDLVRIPPEGCESLENVTRNSVNIVDLVIDASRSPHSSPDNGHAPFDVDNDDVEDIVNFSRSSIAIDGCESESENPKPGISNIAVSCEDEDEDGANYVNNEMSAAKNSQFEKNEPQNCFYGIQDQTFNCTNGTCQKQNSECEESNKTDHLSEAEVTNEPPAINIEVTNQKALHKEVENVPLEETGVLDRAVRLRHSGKKQKPSTGDLELSDDSSDEDSGIYAESHRNSTWIQISDEDQLIIDEKTNTTENLIPENKTSRPNSATILRLVSEDDTVFSNVMGHKRSDSTSTTLSETEFVRQRSYRSRRRCLIQRQNSQQEYQRMSAKVYDQEKLIVIEKKDNDTDFGLHILDSHPAFITSVDPGSPAERCGIQEGQIVISVNGVNTLELVHDDVVKLVQKHEKLVRLEVAYSDFTPVRDIQKPVMAGIMLKLGTSTFVKMWKKRYFVLRQDNCLYYYKNEQELDPLGAIPLSGYCISRYIDTTKDYCFKAEKYGSRTYYFMTDNREEMSRWVGVLTEAAARCKKRKDSWLEVSSHNVGLPALEIRKPECTGSLTKLGQQHKSWQKRYCVLKDSCIYYYKSMNSLSAKGVVHLHGYTVDGSGYNNKKFSFTLHPPDKNMRTFYFCADNQTDKQRWVDCLIRSIQRWIRVDN